jgi:hypothetical protein
MSHDKPGKPGGPPLPPLDPALFEPPMMSAALAAHDVATVCRDSSKAASASTSSRAAPGRASRRSARSCKAARCACMTCSCASARAWSYLARSWFSTYGMDSTTAEIERDLGRLVFKHRYPPDKQPAAIKLVLEQMEAMAPRYAAERG